MRLLLDTNALLWSATDPLQLRPETAEIVRTPKNAVFVSMASLWEIAIKQNIGKLKLQGTIGEWLMPMLSQLRFELLDIRPEHIAQIATLPLVHRDPFDRMIVAQAMALNLTVVTRDRHIKNYGVDVLTA